MDLWQRNDSHIVTSIEGDQLVLKYARGDSEPELESNENDVSSTGPNRDNHGL